MANLNAKLQRFADLIPTVTVLTTGIDAVRRWLKLKGWRRQDRAGDPNRSEELWYPPADISHQLAIAGMSLLSAVKAQLKSEGYAVHNLRV